MLIFSGGILSNDEGMPDYISHRNLWWDKGELSEKAKWNEKYERRTENFNIHKCWEWIEGKVIIYELPSMPHKVCIGAITSDIIEGCIPVKRINAEIYSFGSTKTHDRNCRKEADVSFHPKKPTVTASNRSDENVISILFIVAYTEPLDHVKKALYYWLSPGRVHDCIIVKINAVPQGQVPTRMRAWYYCVSTGGGTRNTPSLVTKFEFSTQNSTGVPLNIVQDHCIINILLS
ncbi:2838_t:CDS:2, partial [Gigaspora rosea]